MIKYIVKRVLFGVLTLLALITATFFLTRLMPGNPFDMANVRQEAQDRIMAYYGLDQPAGQQYLRYVENILHGDFGISYKKAGSTVNELIAAKAPYTLRLGALAYLISAVLGIPAGIWMAATKRESVRGALLTLTTIGVSVPNYVLALVLMLVFGVMLGWFPVLGLTTPAHYVMPLVALSVYPMTQIARLVKSSYSEAMRQDYVIMARAKGIAKLRVSSVHILKNALVPVITASGPMLAFLLTGSFVVENIFTIPGIGREFVNAVSNRDYTVIMGLTAFIGILIVAFNLFSDILCTFVDPRMKLAD
jgi:oligopeptide transport system permease protein